MTSRPTTRTDHLEHPPPRLCRVGTRGSALARRQAALVIDALSLVWPSLACEMMIISTQGDESPDSDLGELGGEGVFVSSIEAALLAEDADAAVHSFKDMPTAQTPGLEIAAFLPRGDARDALVARSGGLLADLPPGARIGTGSPRRRALLLSIRPDLRVEPLRGNVDTRLRRVAEGSIDGAVLAAAGIGRLDRSREIVELLDPSTFVPAVGQGIIAIQCRSEDAQIREALHAIDDAETRACALAERAVAAEIEAGCRVPMGAHARLSGTEIQIHAFIERDGTILREERNAPCDQGPRLGKEIGRALLDRGTSSPSHEAGR